MAFVKKSYEEIVQNILEQITKGVVNERHLYDIARTKYKLENSPVISIARVEGLLNGRNNVFVQGVDYRLQEDMLEWLPEGSRPDQSTNFFVNYAFSGPTGLTDINPGSVVRTIVGAVSREVEFIYSQMDQVYLSGFIDTARGSSLDLVVSLLGVERKPPEHAMGAVTFGRSTDPGEITVDREATLYDGKVMYELKTTPVKNVVRVEGTIKGENKLFGEPEDYMLKGNGIEWAGGGAKPEMNSLFYVDYVAYEQIRVPVGTSVSTFARRPEDTKVFLTTETADLSRIGEGKWEAEIAVKAAQAGKSGNVYAGTLIVMPQPPVGVEYVLNRRDILSGTDAESDEELRERAKHALEVAGKATLVSLESAVRGVEGVTSVLTEDMPDGVEGIVRIVAYGGEEEQILKAINETRAAGIAVEFSRPKPVHIDVSLTVTRTRAASDARVQQGVEAAVRSYLSALDIGEDAVFTRIVRAALDVEGVYDVAEVLIKAYRKEDVVTSSRENIAIRTEEMAVARAVNVLVRAHDRSTG